MRIFIAGPYGDTLPSAEIQRNIERADVVGRHLMKLGHQVYVPHKATGGWEQDKEINRKDIIQLHLSVLREWATCLYRLPGESPGSDWEVQIANSLGIPVVTDIEKIGTVHGQRTIK